MVVGGGGGKGAGGASQGRAQGPKGGGGVLHRITAKGAYGNVNEELFVQTLLLWGLVPVW